jgi:hypothetical protein
MNVERQKILLRSNVSHQRPPIIEMNCQVRRVVTLCILPTFPCPGKGFEGYQNELDAESIFRLPYEKSFILPAENCGMWDVEWLSVDTVHGFNIKRISNMLTKIDEGPRL